MIALNKKGIQTRKKKKQVFSSVESCMWVLLHPDCSRSSWELCCYQKPVWDCHQGRRLLVCTERVERRNETPSLIGWEEKPSSQCSPSRLVVPSICEGADCGSQGRGGKPYTGLKMKTNMTKWDSRLLPLVILGVQLLALNLRIVCLDELNMKGQDHLTFLLRHTNHQVLYRGVMHLKGLMLYVT